MKKIKKTELFSDNHSEGDKLKGLVENGLINKLSMIRGFNHRVISSVVSNLTLPIEAWKEKQSIAPDCSEYNSDDSFNNQMPIYSENVGSESKFSDLSKFIYKEIYAVYKVSDSHISNDWREIHFVDDLNSGLDARVFVNDKTHEVNFAFEGSHGFTKLLAENVVIGKLFKELQQCSDNFTRHITEDEYNYLYNTWRHVLGTDGLSDLQIFANKIPDQFYAGYAWFKRMEKQLEFSQYSDYKQVITGHSLGGGLAQLISAQYKLDTGKSIATVAFEGPGMLTQMEQLAGRDLKSEEFSQIVNFVTKDDLVGEFFNNQHVGLTVSMPYTLSRNDEYWALKYRFGMNLFQKATDIEDIRLDRHDIGQQIDIFNGTDFSYPENNIILTSKDDFYTGKSGKQEIIMGYGGNDRIFGGGANDYICGGDGEDILHGGVGNDFIVGDAGNDRLFGDVGKDLLYGAAGNDYLDGGAGDDRLFGDDGNDTVVWSGGNDLLYGQKGDDTYMLGSSECGSKVSGNVTLKFDREESGDDKVIFDLATIDNKNSKFSFLMSDHILPIDFSINQEGDKLFIKYDNNSSITIENWAETSKTMGNNITFEFGCSPIIVDYKIDHNRLVKVG